MKKKPSTINYQLSTKNVLNKSTIKYIQSLADKKGRTEMHCFIAEGPKIVEAMMVLDNVYIQHMYGLPEWIDQHTILLEQKKISVDVIDEQTLQKISQLQTPNQVLAIVKQFEKLDILTIDNGLYLMLDGIQDPGNMGTIIRTADWFGMDGIICSDDCVDIYNSKVIQGSMASIANVKIGYGNLIDILNKNKLPVYGAVLNGVDIRNVSVQKKGIIIIGNESKGIRKDILPYVTQKITIPKFGKAESLNAAVAVGIVLSYFRNTKFNL